MIKPMGKRVLLEVLEEKEEKHNGLIVIPDTHKQPKAWGKVLALGTHVNKSNTKELPFPCNVGDVVLFPRNAGVDLADVHGTGKHRLVQLDDLICRKE